MSEFGKCSNGHELKGGLNEVYPCEECESPHTHKTYEKSVKIDCPPMSYGPRGMSLITGKKEEKNVQMAANEGPEEYYRVGTRFKVDGYGTYILGSVGVNKVCLVNLTTGNRFGGAFTADPDKVDVSVSFTGYRYTPVGDLPY